MTSPNFPARDDPTDLVIEGLRHIGIEPKGGPDQWQCRCPTHEDSSPSLSITRGDDRRAWVYCHAKCSIAEILRAIGLEPRHLFPERSRVDVRPTPRRRLVETPSAHWARAADECRRRMKHRQLSDLSSRLGVSERSLERLEVGWAERAELADLNGGRARSAGWVFPMRNGRGLIVGLNVRTVDGSKWTVKGGRLGLFIPADFSATAGPVFCVEGASDTAALLDAGRLAVGRPSSHAGAADLAELCRGRSQVSIVGENDKRGDKWPGLEGASAVARKVAAELGIKVPVVMPPANFKDAREWWRSVSQDRNDI